jgi:GMP synthase-like glutamine amidotransferase
MSLVTRPQVAFLQHDPLEAPGVLGSRATELGFEIRNFRIDHGGDPLPDPEKFVAIVMLGSIESVNNTRLGWVDSERAWITRAIACDVPVLGVCFGGQLLAQALGGRVVASPEHEVGWMSIRTDDPSLVSEGPWLLWHEEAVVPPPGALVVARTDVAVQVYLKDRHVGLQFHPEVTPGLVASWIADAQQRGDVTTEQRAALWGDIDSLAAESRHNAGRLFDEFLRRAQIPFSIP